MKIFTLLIFLILLLTAACGESDKTDSELPDYSNASWPIYRGDSNLSGIADSELADSLKLKWSFKTEGDILSSPVLGGGKIFIGSTDGFMYALKIEDGSLVWKFDSEDD